MAHQSYAVPTVPPQPFTTAIDPSLNITMILKKGKRNDERHPSPLQFSLCLSIMTNLSLVFESVWTTPIME